MNLADFREIRAVVLLAVTAISSVALFTKFVSGGEWCTLMGTALSLFTAHCIADDKWPDRNNGG